MVEPPVPKVPMDYTWAKRLGLVRKPANFISSISDDRGDELRSVVRPEMSWFTSILFLEPVLRVQQERSRFGIWTGHVIQLTFFACCECSPI